MTKAVAAAHTPAIDQPPLDRHRWTLPLALLAVSIAILLGLFAPEGAAAVHTWESSTAYNHCWLVLPVAAWLAWGRRGRLAGLTCCPSPWFALLAVPVALAWLAAQRMGIMEGRQLMALALVWIVVLGALGWGVCRAMAAPLAYLVFLVPFGAFAVPALQAVTARMIVIGLSVLGIPHYVDSLVIETPAGSFLVAEACAGLRFVVAALAFGALYALTMFHTPGRRLVVMVLALGVPIVANGIRALGIVVLGQYLGSATAATADHLVYGFGFFSVVILLLVLAGLPFRQAPMPIPLPILPSLQAGRPRARAGRSMGAVGAALLPAIAVWGVAAVLARSGNAAPEGRGVRLVAPAGCEAVPGTGALNCPGATLTATLLVFPASATWDAVAGQRRHLAGEDDEDIVFHVAGSAPGAPDWLARQPKERPGVVAVAGWLDGRPVGDGLHTRVIQAWNSLAGGHGTPVIAAVRLRADTEDAGADAQARQRDVMRNVLQAQGGTLVAQAAAASAHK